MGTGERVNIWIIKRISKPEIECVEAEKLMEGMFRTVEKGYYYDREDIALSVAEVRDLFERERRKGIVLLEDRLAMTKAAQFPEDVPTEPKKKIETTQADEEEEQEALA